jgi:hypothetical protein
VRQKDRDGDLAAGQDLVDDLHGVQRRSGTVSKSALARETRKRSRRSPAFSTALSRCAQSPVPPPKRNMRHVARKRSCFSQARPVLRELFQ